MSQDPRPLPLGDGRAFGVTVSSLLPPLWLECAVSPPKPQAEFGPQVVALFGEVWRPQLQEVGPWGMPLKVTSGPHYFLSLTVPRPPAPASPRPAVNRAKDKDGNLGTQGPKDPLSLKLFLSQRHKGHSQRNAHFLFTGKRCPRLARAGGPLVHRYSPKCPGSPLPPIPIPGPHGCELTRASRHVHLPGPKWLWLLLHRPQRTWVAFPVLVEGCRWTLSGHRCF